MSNLESNVGAAQAKYPDIVIMDNNVSTHRPCGICGQDWKPDIGLELFLDGGRYEDAVCYQCGLKHAPKLVAALEAVWAAETAKQAGKVLVQQEPCGCNSHLHGEGAFFYGTAHYFQICRKHKRFRNYAYHPPLEGSVGLDGSNLLQTFAGLWPLKDEDGQDLLRAITGYGHDDEITF